MVAEVIIISNVKGLNRVFDYEIPAQLVGIVNIGSKVLVPFGRYKTLTDAYVIALKEKSEYKLKQIIEIDKQFSITPENIKLAQIMSKRYFCNIADAIKLMLPPGILTKDISNRVKEKSRDFVFLNKEIEDIEQDIIDKKLKSEKQIRTLKFLIENDGVLVSDLEIFADTTRAIINTLKKNGYVEIEEKQVVRNPFIHKNIARDTKLILNEEQTQVYNSISKYIDENKYEQFLIYGVTGSGKTEIYMQLIERALEQGKNAIMLVPEISLTPQMVDRFIARFGQEKIAVLHSKLSLGERYDEWNRIRKKEANIVIGARSAIFAPIQNLGIIIIDEEHDQSYKADTTPRYNAKDIAKYLAKENDIPVVLGSATPDIATFYKANEKEIKLLTLSKRANESALPNIEIVDLKEELINGNKSMISMKLYDEIQENLKNKKQTILFLNRRGFSTFVMCRDCRIYCEM